MRIIKFRKKFKAFNKNTVLKYIRTFNNFGKHKRKTVYESDNLIVIRERIECIKPQTRWWYFTPEYYIILYDNNNRLTIENAINFIENCSNLKEVN